MGGSQKRNETLESMIRVLENEKKTLQDEILLLERKIMEMQMVSPRRRDKMIRAHIQANKEKYRALTDSFDESPNKKRKTQSQGRNHNRLSLDKGTSELSLTSSRVSLLGKSLYNSLDQHIDHDFYPS